MIQLTKHPQRDPVSAVETEVGQAPLAGSNFLIKRLVLFWVLSAVVQSPLCRGGLLLDTNVPSRILGWNRAIHIYLPPSYESNPQRRYPVLYLHDGQNAFSSAGTNCAFGWGSWELDKTADELCRSGKMREIIMVAVDNSFARYDEYCGRHHATNAPSSASTNTPFENYGAFLITELKPRIDREFRTLSDPAHTGVMGSSMGGICSLVLAWEHPDIFGGAASLSGAFMVEQTNFLNGVLKNFRGQPEPLRVYLDSGVVDFMGGDDGQTLTGQVAAELRRIGWAEDLRVFVDAKPLMLAELEKAGLRRDKTSEAQTSQHNEFYWRLRSWRALTFLFPPNKLERAAP
jgi:predicted alpha/beta superfamily hydrolase